MKIEGISTRYLIFTIRTRGFFFSNQCTTAHIGEWSTVAKCRRTALGASAGRNNGWRHCRIALAQIAHSLTSSELGSACILNIRETAAADGFRMVFTLGLSRTKSNAHETPPSRSDTAAAARWMVGWKDGWCCGWMGMESSRQPDTIHTLCAGLLL
jgi:hypothetical protein